MNGARRGERGPTRHGASMVPSDWWWMRSRGMLPLWTHSLLLLRSGRKRLGRP